MQPDPVIAAGERAIECLTNDRAVSVDDLLILAGEAGTCRQFLLNRRTSGFLAVDGCQRLLGCIVIGQLILRRQAQS